MDFFDVEGVLVELMLEDQLFQIVERLLVESLVNKEDSFSRTGTVSV